LIETERLCLIPLTAGQLRLWLEDVQTLENELNCTYRAEPLEGLFKNIVSGQLDKTGNDADNYLFHSFWFIIRKTDRVVVGSCDFKDVPNENGEVEIGYGLGKEYEGAGYMTEAIKAFCEWAMARKEISQVVAETETNNPKSENVLKRAGFTLYEQNDSKWWRYRHGNKHK
jgi:RimJ/RimL family protein N-acetyltransferase